MMAFPFNLFLDCCGLLSFKFLFGFTILSLFFIDYSTLFYSTLLYFLLLLSIPKDVPPPPALVTSFGEGAFQVWVALGRVIRWVALRTTIPMPMAAVTAPLRNGSASIWFVCPGPHFLTSSTSKPSLTTPWTWVDYRFAQAQVNDPYLILWGGVVSFTFQKKVKAFGFFNSTPPRGPGR